MLETATRFLSSVVEEEGCAYATQKQALSALKRFLRSTGQQLVLGRQGSVAVG